MLYFLIQTLLFKITSLLIFGRMRQRKIQIYYIELTKVMLVRNFNQIYQISSTNS